MRWPFSRKANPVSRVIVLGLNVTGPVHHDNYERLANDGYKRNPTVYACVSTIAQACATVPWVLYEFGRTSNSKARRIMSLSTHQKSFVKSADGVRYPFLRKALAQTEVTDHPLLKLLERPNDSQAQGDYIEQLISYWLISGNAYEKFLAPESGPNRGRPIEIWNLRPDRTEVLPSDNPAIGIVGGYQYTVNGRKEKPFEPTSVIHHKFFNPTDDFYGMSPLQASVRAWQTENLGSDWNYALLNNAGRTSGALVAPTTVADDVYDRLKAEIRESYMGAKNAGTPMFLEGGIKWEPMGLTPMELDFLAGMRDAAIRICRVYHLAPEIIGVPDAKTYNSLAEARKAMWQEANLPLLDRLRDSYNQRLAPLFGDRIFVDYDRDQIDALQEDRAKVFDMFNRTRFLSTNEKRVGTGFETIADPLADVPESILNPTPGATGQPGFPSGTVTSLRSFADMVRKAVEDSKEWTPEQKAAALATLDANIAELEEKAKRLTSRQRALEEVIRKGMSRHFKEQGANLANFLRNEIRKLAA